VFWDRDIECMARDALEILQIKRLKETVERAGRAPFYHDLFSREGLSPESIENLADLKRFPLTTKEDLRSAFPDGFVAVPEEEVVRLHVSSGTTGTPTAVYHTQRDLEAWADMVARSLYMAGVRKSDVFQNMVGYGLFTGGLGLHYGAEKLGAAVIPSGVGNSRRQIALIRQFKTTSFHAIPSYALKLLETFREIGVDPKTETALRIAVVGAEPYSEETRQRIEAGYGVFAANCYGLSELNGPGVAFECPHKTGMHLWEDNYVLEIVDPDTLEPLPDDVVGEIVLTTLKREAMPLIRYRTRDLAMIQSGPCPCGRTHRRISRIRGRSDDMLILKGVNIYPMQVEQVLMSFGEVGNNYVIVLDRKGSVDQLTVKIEVTPDLLGMGLEGMEDLRRKLTNSLRDEILITPKVELVEPGSLAPGEGKAVRVVDNRGKKD
jgi:phenylacetate-CoA ligase